MLKKGVYPYEYINNWLKFYDTDLPETNKFYSSLNLTNITSENYKHAKNVWKTFNKSNMGEYHDLYVQSDTAQLADIFEQIRTLCLREYKLDPAYYCRTPGLAFDVFLKYTIVKLELITDENMHLMFEKGIRGGISQVIDRYAIANNKYMNKYDKNAPSNYIMHLDANNLYGYLMCKKLPLNNYTWDTDIDKFTCDFIKNYDGNYDTGYLLEVDIGYAEILHELHRYLPFLLVTKDKLLTTLEDKKNYIVHISTLQQALKHDLSLQKVHSVISYRQEAYLKPYIDKNTELRKNATNNFEKNFFKLMNNSVFGKTMENVRNRRDVKLIVSEHRRKKLTSEPNYESCKQSTDTLMAIEMKKTEVYFDKPIAIGQAVLDIIKNLMYKFYYDYLFKKYQDNVTLCYMDTDSFILDIKTDHFYKDINNDVNICFDTSNYSNNLNRPLKGGINKKVIGKFKDELGGKLLTEFVGLIAKTSFYTQIDGDKIYESKRY